MICTDLTSKHFPRFQSVSFCHFWSLELASLRFEPQVRRLHKHVLPGQVLRFGNLKFALKTQIRSLTAFARGFVTTFHRFCSQKHGRKITVKLSPRQVKNIPQTIRKAPPDYPKTDYKPFRCEHTDLSSLRILRHLPGGAALGSRFTLPYLI